jgi:two-component system, NarL family, response regulator LiaR
MQRIIKLVLVDDHPIVRQGLRTIFELQPDFTVVGEAETGETALQIIASSTPDVVLLDLALPDISGVEVATRISTAYPTTYIVVLTSYHDDAHLLSALRAGALSYVLKDMNPGDLIDIVRRAARGEAFLHPRVATRVVQEIRVARPNVSEQITQLSSREREVLSLLATGHSNGEIARELIISEKTVKSHVSSILGKLQLNGRTQAAAFAWNHGLVPRE